MLECISPPGSHDSHCTSAAYMRSADAAAQQDLAEHDVERDGRQDEVAGGRPGELADDAAHRHRGVDLVQDHAGQAHAGGDRQSSCRAGTAGRQGRRRRSLLLLLLRARAPRRRSPPRPRPAPTSSRSGRTGRAVAGEKASRPRTSSSSDSTTKNSQAGEPQALRDHQRRLDRRQRARARHPGLPDDAPGVPGDHAEEAQRSVPRLTRSSTARTPIDLMRT